jgi:hypothetical protein
MAGTVPTEAIGEFMPRPTRSENLALAGHLNGGVTNTADKLVDLTNRIYVSGMMSGDREISDYDARRIEKLLALPDGWMDRDNLEMLAMGKVDFDIYSRLSGKPDAAKAEMLAFLAATVQ